MNKIDIYEEILDIRKDALKSRSLTVLLLTEDL